MDAIQVRTLIFQDSGMWCAQCLEFDIGIQARAKDQVLPELLPVLSDYIETSRDDGCEPFTGLPPAPSHFFDMFNRSAEWNGVPVLESEMAPQIVPTLRYLQSPLPMSVKA